MSMRHATLERTTLLACAASFLFAGAASAQQAAPDIPPITFKISIARALPQEGGITADCVELAQTAAHALRLDQRLRTDRLPRSFRRARRARASDGIQHSRLAGHGAS